MLRIRAEVRDQRNLPDLSRAISTASRVALAFNDEGVLRKTVVSSVRAHHDCSGRDTGVHETQVAPPAVVVENHSSQQCQADDRSDAAERPKDEEVLDGVRKSHRHRSSAVCLTNKVLSGGPHAGEETSAEPGPPGKTG